MTIETIVFDLGGVLVDWNPRYLYRTLFDGDEEAMELFLSEVCDQDWNECQDAGRPFAEAIAERAKDYPEQRGLIQAYFERWPEMIRGSIGGTVALLAELEAENRPLYALTNWSAETFPVAQARFAFLKSFRGIVVSGVEKVKKPDPRIYRILLERYGLDAERCLFIDDSKANVEAARGLGFAVHHFKGADGLRRRLVAEGLLP